MSNRHLARLIVAMYLIFALAISVGFYMVTQEARARAAAVCKSENETRSGIRNFLHAEFKITPQQSPTQQDAIRTFLDDSDRRFAKKKCRG